MPCSIQLRRYQTYVEVLAARILANGEDAEMVDSLLVVQQQPTLAYITDLDHDGGVESSSPSSDKSSDLGAGIGGGGSSSSSSTRAPTNRYSYRAAIYQHPENPQDIG